MGPRHGSRANGSATRRQPAALNEIGTRFQFRYKLGNHGEVVALIRVTHDDKFSASGGDPTAKRTSIIGRRDALDPSTRRHRDRDRSVSAAIVGNDHLTEETRIAQGRHRLRDARPHRVLLIEARNHDRDGNRCCAPNRIELFKSFDHRNPPPAHRSWFGAILRDVWWRNQHSAPNAKWPRPPVNPARAQPRPCRKEHPVAIELHGLCSAW